MTFLQALPLPKSAPPSNLPRPNTGPVETYNIGTDDLIDRLGFGKLFEQITTTILALFCAAVLAGVLLWILRLAFGSKESKRESHDAIEKALFDLQRRDGRADGLITGLTGQIKAVEMDLNKRFPERV